VARALEIAHQQRIVHRDLKPGNLFLHKSLEGTIVPKILDFGISKLTGPNHDPMMTSAGTVLGSPAYMSPEQAAGELDVDGRSDVWSLGVILYKCLCGTVPFSAPNYNALMMAISLQPPTPITERVPGIPESIAAIVNKCLAKRREDRFPSAKALSEAIDRVLSRTTLPTIELATIIAAPMEIFPDDAKTIATENSQGTLAATETEVEIDDQAATRAIDSGSRENVIAPYGTQALQETMPRARSVPPPSFRAKISRNMWMAAGAGGFVLLALIIGVSASKKGDDPAPSTPGAAPAFSTPVHPVEGNKDKDKKPKLTLVDEPTIGPSASASSAPTQSASAVKTSTSPPTKWTPPRKTEKTATPKPPNEGVTGAGF
jgi:serine/threonine protein kinase